MRDAHRDRLPTSVGLGLGFALVSLSASFGCKPSVDTGCDADDECERGLMCELETAECIPKQIDTSSTENPAPATFSAKPVPFFRGQVCTVGDVKAGSPIPIHLDPCFHPCLASNSFHHKHYYSCVGTNCDAWAIMYIEAAATACPADAFSKFDPALCVYDKAVDLTITATVDGEPVLGKLQLEVPYLSNTDMAEIAANFDDTEFLRSKIDQYPQEPGRLVGPPIKMTAASPEPPASCAGGACPCYQVGF